MGKHVDRAVMACMLIGCPLTALDFSRRGDAFGAWFCFALWIVGAAACVMIVRAWERRR